MVRAFRGKWNRMMAAYFGRAVLKPDFLGLNSGSLGDVLCALGPARKAPYEKKKVKEQMNYVNNLDDFTQSSETVSEDGGVLYSTSSTLQVDPLDVGCKDSVSLFKIQDAILSREMLVGFQRSHSELLRGEFYKMKSKVRGLQKELSETKEVKSQSASESRVETRAQQLEELISNPLRLSWRSQHPDCGSGQEDRVSSTDDCVTRPRPSALRSSIIPGTDRGHHGTNFKPGYHIRDKDLGEIHKAASVGSVAKTHQVLLLGKNGLNDKDKMNRTALHLACACGHAAVVAFLLERKCLLNLCDAENKTALMKAVECQEEECATLLLEHGADPNVVDVYGNTALHYAVLFQNVSLAAKLLSYDANIEARNQDDLTPLLLGIRERKQQIVEFLVKKEADIHAVDKMKRTALMLAVNYECMDVVSLLLQRGADIFSQDVFGRTAEEYAVISGFKIICKLISEYKEKRPKTPPEKSNPVDKRSEEDSLSRFSNKPGVDSWLTSDDKVLDFETKHVPKRNSARLTEAFQQSKRNKAECGIVRPGSTTFSEDKNSDLEIGDVVETFPKTSPGVQGFSHPAFPRPEPLPEPVRTPAGLGLAKEGATKPDLVEKESDADIIERAPQEQADHDHLTSVDRAHKNNRSDMMSAVGLGEEKDIESPWDSESISESVPRKFVDHLSGDQRGKNILNGQVDVPPEKCLNVKPAVGVKDSVPNKTAGKKGPQTSSSDRDSTSSSLSRETCQRAGHLKVDDQRPLVSQSVTKNQSAPTELGLKTVPDKEKMKKAAVFLVGNSTPHHLCQSPLPKNRESKEDLSGELDLDVILEEEQEKLDGDERNHSQVEEGKSSEVEVSDSVWDAAAESRWIQQRKRGGNKKQEFPAMQNEGSDSLRTSFSISYEAGLVVMSSLSSDPGVPRKEIEKKNNGNWTQEECVIAPIFGKTDSLPGGLLHVNDDSILRKEDREDGRPARKTAYEKKVAEGRGPLPLCPSALQSTCPVNSSELAPAFPAEFSLTVESSRTEFSSGISEQRSSLPQPMSLSNTDWVPSPRS
ncbi:ankyrin repeat domain-containing protein 26-like [Moschus berezovskii]|uniref:ankyrin repeat domain-containing protein 26-like n=1 Tax=Moschus berezovskii TaxID=68408 RepID=UPI00244423AC|nr:ankyrin repeat domain-containing protein 26-like [Moschus berezovskii]